MEFSLRALGSNPQSDLVTINTVIKYIYICVYICPFWEHLSENNIIANTYIGYTMTTLSHRLTYHLSDISAVKKHIMTKHNKDIDKLKSPNIRKILINNTKIIYKSNNKNCLQILKAITIKIKNKNYDKQNSIQHKY